MLADIREGAGLCNTKAPQFVLLLHALLLYARLLAAAGAS